MQKQNAEPLSQVNRTVWPLCVVLVALTVAAFWPVRLNEFINYDDQDYVTANPMVKRGLSWEGLGWAFRTGHAANWHPLTWLSHMFDVQLFNLRPAAHHLANVVLHVANTLLLFHFLRGATGTIGRSAAVAALFAVHPLHVESVAWVAERKDVLSTFFGLLSLCAYVCYTRLFPGGAPTVANRRAWFYVAAMACFALALMSKPMLVTLPAAMLLLDAWPLRRKAIPRARLLIEKIPFFVLAVASGIVTLLVQQKAMLFHKSLSFGARVANAVVSCVRYLELTMWPRDLAVLYPHPGQWPAHTVIISSMLLAIISLTALANWKRRPYLVIGWLWYLGMLTPTLGFVQVGVQAMADRYTYLPLVGVFIMIVWTASEAMNLARVPIRLRIAAASTLVIVCAMCTWSQVQLWHDTKRLFTHAAAVTDKNWVAEYKLGLVALEEYENTAHGNVADQRSGAAAPTEAHARLSEVVKHCEAALSYEPRVVDPHVTVAKALTESGRLDEARRELEMAVRLDPGKADARQNLAEILYRQGRVKDSVTQYREALALSPDWESVLNNLGWILATNPDPDVRDGAEAVRLAERASRLTGETNLWFQHTLAAAYAEKGDFTQAVAAAERACRLATNSGSDELVRAAATRLNLYESGRPLRIP